MKEGTCGRTDERTLASTTHTTHFTPLSPNLLTDIELLLLLNTHTHSLCASAGRTGSWLVPVIHGTVSVLVPPHAAAVDATQAQHVTQGPIDSDIAARTSSCPLLARAPPLLHQTRGETERVPDSPCPFGYPTLLQIVDVKTTQRHHYFQKSIQFSLS